MYHVMLNIPNAERCIGKFESYCYAELFANAIRQQDTMERFDLVSIVKV